MTSFLIALAVLIGGYIIYGAIVEKIFGIEPNRVTPAFEKNDGIDYMPLPTWKVFLIQFLNIAGLGPIFGAIMGIMFGPAAFLWIVLGTIFGGAVHDFTSAMISIRSGGLSLPEIVGKELGMTIKKVMGLFSALLLILVGAVFVITPAGIIANMTPESLNATFWIIAIFIYYILATLLPIDKLIGNFYPIFGFALLFMALGLLGHLLFSGMTIPVGFEDGLYCRYAGEAAKTHPVFPMMFVSIACGAISGFHATQSPMMARCIKNEKLARPVFYGAMVAEGLVALIWAAAAITFCGSYDGLSDYMAQPGHSAGTLVTDISTSWLGKIGGILAILGVVAAPITTGDTALRSARLIMADFFHIKQKKIVKRLLISLPVFALTFAIMLIDFNVLWRYFAWSNQTLSVFTLWAVTVYLARKNKNYFITMLPAMFMTVVSCSYLLVAQSPEGFGLNYNLGVGIGCTVAVVFMLLFLRYRRHILDGKVIIDSNY
jgi:carbon starvation protein CstA